MYMKITECIYSKKTIDFSRKYIIYGIEFKSSSFSIIKDINNPDVFILNFRFVNYDIIKNIHTSRLKNYFITLNKIIKVDKNLNIIEEKSPIVPFYLQTLVKNYNINYKKRIYGIEDVRFFNYNNKIKIIGTHEVNTSTTGILSGEYCYKSNNFLNTNYIKCGFNNHHVEKNWVYFEMNDDLRVIYKWYPLQIGLISNKNTLDMVKKIDMPIFFKKARGSTCGIKYNDEIWFICHFNDNAYYSHFFTVFDENMNLKKFSKNFTFEKNKIEFCIGFYIDKNDDFYIPYSVDDTKSKLGIYSLSTINNLPWHIV